VDTIRIAQEECSAVEEELFAAACAAMRLLQDRQAHTPLEMLDLRERKVLRHLRQTVRRASDDEDLS